VSNEGFRDRTTMGPGVKITLPDEPDAQPPAKVYVSGPGHEPTDAEALAMAKALAKALGITNDQGETPTK
jgi:hypothetical protein